MKRKRDSHNEGIQGNVQAEVVAAGHGAKATKNVYTGSVNQAGLDSVLSELTKAIGALELPTLAADTLKKDVEELEDAARKPEPNRDRVKSVLESLSGKLKMVGVVLTETAALGAPLLKIAKLFQIQLTPFGL